MRERETIIDYEKAGSFAPVWQMTPVRKPRATGLVFELADGRAQTPAAPHSPTNSNNQTIQHPVLRSLGEGGSNNSRIVYWLDAQNRLTIESILADTNATPWCATLPFAPLTGGRSLAITAPTNSFTLASTTNVFSVALRPMTNMQQRVEIQTRL